MRCDQLQPSWKPSFLCCSECSRKIREYAPDLISCSRVRSEHVLGCSFLCGVTQNVQSKTAIGQAFSQVKRRKWRPDVTIVRRFSANILRCVVDHCLITENKHPYLALTGKMVSVCLDLNT